MNLQESFLRARSGGVMAALPQLGLAATCLAGLLVPALARSLSPRMLLTLGLEFFAIHAFIPLGGLALWRPKRWWTHAIRIGAFAALAWIYSSQVAMWGREAVASFWMLTGATYLGFFVHDAAASRKKLLFARWAVNAVAYIAILFAVLVTCDALGIHSPRRELLAGMTFFAALAYFDLAGIYARVTRWLPQGSAQAEQG